MKKALSTLLFCLLAGTAMQAQGPSASGDQRFAIKINPLSIFLLTGNVQGEAAITDRMSVQLGAYYTGLKFGSSADGASGKIGYNLFALTPEVRFYLLKAQSAPRGLYVAPFARFQKGKIFGNASVDDPDTGAPISAAVTARLTTFGGGATIGYQLITPGGFVFDAFVGPQFGVAKVDLSAECEGCDGNEDIPLIGREIGAGPGLRLGIAIGYAF